MDRYRELFPDADESVKIIPLGAIVSPELASALRSLDVVGCVVTHVRRAVWVAAIVMVDDVWMLPAMRRKQAALGRLREVLQELTSMEPVPSEPIPVARERPLIEALEDAAHRMRLMELMDWDELDARRRGLSKQIRAELRDINPSWAPFEVADAIVRLGYHHHLPRRKLFDYWFGVHGMAPDIRVIAQLPSGRRTWFSENDDDRPLTTHVEPLISAILSDTMDRVIQRPVKSSWDAHLAFVAQEINRTVEHTVMPGMHPYIAKVMLWAILQQLAREQFLSYIVAAFPHLQADPERLAEAIEAGKSGAVLILGSDTGESLERLHAIRGLVESILGFSGIIIKEQPELIEHGLVGKLHAYGAMTRFVIVENSHPSGHL